MISDVIVSIVTVLRITVCAIKMEKNVLKYANADNAKTLKTILKTFILKEASPTK